MELRKEHLGKTVYLKGLGRIVISEETAPILQARNMHQFFITGIELQPLPEIALAAADEAGIPKIVLPDPVVKSPSMSDDLKYLRDQICIQALNGFEGRTAKFVKKDLDLLGIEYSKNASLPMLAELVKSLP